MRQANAAANGMGLLHDFVYLDYANQAQDPIATYGRENIASLKRVADRYDPRGVFQRQVPGGFKLPVSHRPVRGA